jgi:TolA-binding protein
MKKISLIITTLAVPAMLSAEPSAFNAGKVDPSTQNYSVQSNQPVVVNNQERYQELKSDSFTMVNRLESTEEAVAGIRSILDGINNQVGKNRQDSFKMEARLAELEKLLVQKNQEENAALVQERDTLEQRVGALEKKLEEFSQRENENNKKMQTVLQGMSELIDTINVSYASKKSIILLNDEFTELKKAVLKELKTIEKVAKPVDPFEGKNNEQIASEADDYFEKGEYNLVIMYFEHLIKADYKPARAHYFIGESYFKMKKYETAIAYFKESAKLYNKAPYMPQLLLHTALSFDYLGEYIHAKNFFEMLVSEYPKSEEAKEAKKRLAKM